VLFRRSTRVLKRKTGRATSSRGLPGVPGSQEVRKSSGQELFWLFRRSTRLLKRKTGRATSSPGQTGRPGSREVMESSSKECPSKASSYQQDPHKHHGWQGWQSWQAVASERLFWSERQKLGLRVFACRLDSEGSCAACCEREEERQRRADCETPR
jgi:hypothetical protein